jgi:signal peptidase I
MPTEEGPRDSGKIADKFLDSWRSKQPSEPAETIHPPSSSFSEISSESPPTGGASSVSLPDAIVGTLSTTIVAAPEAPFDDHDTRPKPFLARACNNIGIRTSPNAEWLLDWVQVLAVAGLLAWVTMTFVIVRMRVPTGSMKPTIMEGDSFFVDKLSFYLRKPVPGDIVVFWHNESTGPVRYVKRLIASGGQRVQIRDNCHVYVDGIPMTDDAFNHPNHPNRDRRCYTPGGEMQRDEWVVPEGKFFVLGDNTGNSLDSRYWGFADEKDFIGEPFLKVWPLPQIGFMNGYFGSSR